VLSTLKTDASVKRIDVIYFLAQGQELSKYIAEVDIKKLEESLAGTVRPDWISLRMVSLERP
jgi:hypothetical protein